MQVMYFLPQMREYFLQAVPDAAKEFSLLDELALLFRMLASESGHACQATNLLRALRQAREAGGLGLLEGHASGGQSGTDIEVYSLLPPGILTASSDAKNLSATPFGKYSRLSIYFRHSLSLSEDRRS